ncbi:MAG TPA: NAD(P)H-dependent glycerol-3-phosphate dehydrogenase [Coprothermobacter proteolyticus]|nr:NAD(P)H-dependent glycerol-3-phosphate dehydrogenase [Coprothermobacter proteolyticus]
MRQLNNKACILGSGSWAGALSVVLTDNGFEVSLWARNPYTVDCFVHTRTLPRLPGVILPSNVNVTTRVDEALSEACLVVAAIPSSGISSLAHEIATSIPAQSLLVSATKGFDYSTLQRPSEVWVEANPDLKERMCVLSGPNFAAEIGRRLPAATVVASEKETPRLIVQRAFMTPYFRVYTHDDVAGVEMGGALKNVIALCAGISDGLGFGDNTKAALMTRGIAEISRLGVSMGANPQTFAGLTGVGDLIVTCTSMHSRNRRAGILIGQGKSLKEAVDEVKMVVEGVTTTKAAYELANQEGVTMPITFEAYNVLFNGKNPKLAVSDLMMRNKKNEAMELWDKLY